MVRFVLLISTAVGRRWPALVEAVPKAFQVSLETPSAICGKILHAVEIDVLFVSPFPRSR
jgi:hypothetical protein